MINYKVFLPGKNFHSKVIVSVQDSGQDFGGLEKSSKKLGKKNNEEVNQTIEVQSLLVRLYINNFLITSWILSSNYSTNTWKWALHIQVHLLGSQLVSTEHGDSDLRGYFQGTTLSYSCKDSLQGKWENDIYENM